jgi:UDP-N-acetylmuramyl pentapeptide phosphotransferase/UDP-N-acetylglucosamine-1-phosphate transferase
MILFLAALAVSLVTTFLLVYQSGHRGARAIDNRFDQPQKIHARPVSRIGGLGVFVALVTVTIPAHWILGPEDAAVVGLLMICALPAFLAGLVHDFTDGLPPRGRLLATAVSALLAVYVLGTGLHQTDILPLDWLAATSWGAAALAVLSVAGVANAVNIIDGLNGLASMCVVIMLAAIAYVAYDVDDQLVGALALAGIGAVLGFFVWNYPAGLIFLGDGGAYFLGFYVSEVVLLLLLRSDQVSPLFGLLVCIYPIFETLFSAYRRYWLHGKAPSLPDGIHLHTLVYRRLIRWAVGSRSADELTRRNSMASPYLWVLCSTSVAPAMLFYDQPAILGGFIVLFAASYLVLYRRIVRFRFPGWLKVGRSLPSGDASRDNPDP